MIGIASNAFFPYFQEHFPELELFNPENISRYKLVIFPGGADIGPRYYGMNNIYCGGIDSRRDVQEFNTLKQIKMFNMSGKGNIKVLGVCRGLQLIMASFGYKLIQDISIQLNSYHGSPHTLDISIETELSTMFEKVNSLHHQGVQFPYNYEVNPDGFIYTAHHNNIMEIIESNNYILVQFHPELMSNGKVFFDYIKNWIK